MGAWLRLTAILPASLLWWGCIIAGTPYPATKKIEAHTPSKQSFDLSFIRPGTTTHAEITGRLGTLDAGADLPGIFWGRYMQSNMGSAGIVAVEYAGGTAWGGRIWSNKNLWLTFDEKGIVTASRIFGDKELASTLSSWVSAHPRTPKLPWRVDVNCGESAPGCVGHLTFEENGFSFEANSGVGTKSTRCPGCDLLAPPRVNQIPSENVLSLELQSPSPKLRKAALQGMLWVRTDNKKKICYLIDGLTADQALDLIQFTKNHSPQAKL